MSFYCKELDFFLDEEELSKNHFYSNSLPQEEVSLRLKIKSPLILCGTPYFIAVFKHLAPELNFNFSDLSELEGKPFAGNEIVELQQKIPFNIAISAERLGLNLLQRLSAISTFTAQMVTLARPYSIKVLDTRKTTPGLRGPEKYAVRIGGGSNHRFSQTDVWMIKDNHKTFFGGLKPAYEYFSSLASFYTPIIAEIHNLEEYDLALKLGIKHLMLDNFQPQEIKKALEIKPQGTTIEISGGITPDNFNQYCIAGVDAISMGALTHSVPAVDISLKFLKA